MSNVAGDNTLAQVRVHVHVYSPFFVYKQCFTLTCTCVCTQEPFIIECVNFVASRAPKPITAGTVLTQEMVVVILSCIQPFVRYVPK